MNAVLDKDGKPLKVGDVVNVLFVIDKVQSGVENTNLVLIPYLSVQENEKKATFLASSRITNLVTPRK